MVTILMVDELKMVKRWLDELKEARKFQELADLKSLIM